MLALDTALGDPDCAQLTSNQPCIATATYRPECGCKVALEIKRGEMPPPCPKCKRTVNWTFVRSTYLDEAVKAKALTGPDQRPSREG